jgi:hypothetical protein
MNRRNILNALLDALADTPVVFLRGARQSGKTTLVKNLAPDEIGMRNYVTLDSATALAAALRDPTGFLNGLPKPLTPHPTVDFYSFLFIELSSEHAKNFL